MVPSFSIFFGGISMNIRVLACAAAGIAIGYLGNAYAEQPPSPCHPNPNAAADRGAVANREDVEKLPQALKDRLIQLADRPHTYLPLQVFAEADKPSQLFQYYLLDADGFEPNVFTTRFSGINDAVQLTATGGNCGLPTLGAVRVALEPKPGLPTDPTNPRAFIDVFTDISPLFVINNEGGWYEGWMIHDLIVPATAPPRRDGAHRRGRNKSRAPQRQAQRGYHRPSGRRRHLERHWTWLRGILLRAILLLLAFHRSLVSGRPRIR